MDEVNNFSSLLAHEADIKELEKKIKTFETDVSDEESFRAFRLARGVYGQRQEGVQMVRIKIPYGKVTSEGLRKICDATDKYSDGMLHITTRQDIQIYYVSLDDTPALWEMIREGNITLREACGNTVRNITSSAIAGVDPNEPFDVTPHVQSVFEFFLRNPLNQELGRKFKIAFASSEENVDSFLFIHDIGFIPKIKDKKRGFSVVVGGGLGAQPQPAIPLYDFIEESKIIPLTESILRIFNQNGERKRRMKARFKFLLKEIGIEKLKKEIEKEINILEHSEVEIKNTLPPEKFGETHTKEFEKDEEFENWVKTNVIEQKHPDYLGVFITVPLGNIYTNTARKLANIVDKFADDDIRFTQNQDIFLRNIHKKSLFALYQELSLLNLIKDGYNGVADVTACPGTDTCNLGISNSTTAAKEIEALIRLEFPSLISEKGFDIKLSGCPNSCGQHGLASIGFHGSSQKVNGKLMPFLQVCLGGGVLKNGKGRVAEKVIKIPSKRVLEVVKTLLKDYAKNRIKNDSYSTYFERQGKMYFYHLLSSFADITNVTNSDYLDWGNDDAFALKKAQGECAGVVVDLFSSIIEESQEKIALSEITLKNDALSDSIYHSYHSIIQSSKAFLLTKDILPSNQSQIIEETEKLIGKPFEEGNFSKNVFRYRKQKPTKSFAVEYQNFAKDVFSHISTIKTP